MKSEKKNNTLEDLISIVKKLRSPDGCDWDKQQTHESLFPYFLEESHEVVEAIQSKNYDSLKEELGDLFLHIIFQIDLAEEKKKLIQVGHVERYNPEYIYFTADTFLSVSKKELDEFCDIYSKFKKKNIN